MAHEYIYNTSDCGYESCGRNLYSNIYEGFLYEGDVLSVESDEEIDDD